MEVNKKFFPKIMLDNDIIFIQSLLGLVESVDELCSVEIVYVDKKYKIRIAPSTFQYLNGLMEEILKFHNLFHLKLDLGKSIKTSGVIFFEISLLE